MASVTFDKATRLYPAGTRPAVDKLDLEVGDGSSSSWSAPRAAASPPRSACLRASKRSTRAFIFIGDRNVTDVPPKDRDIAMVFQNYALYPHMTVAENMGFALKIAGIGKEERAARVLEAAKLLDLEPYLNRKPKALGRPASARRHGPRDRAPAAGVPHGRAAVEPRRQARVQTRTQIARCSAASASPRSTSRTTRPRRSPWATASRCSRTASCSRSAPRASSTSGRTTCSSPASSARPR